MLNEDYKEMLQCLLEEDVRFLLVGAYAVAVYGYPRATKDIDIFVRAAPENASSLMKALARFGAPLSDVSESDFSTEGVVFQIGNSPRRIDILTRISGVEFESAYANRKTISIAGMEVPIISLESHRQQARHRPHTGSGRCREAGSSFLREEIYLAFLDDPPTMSRSSCRS